MSTNTKPFDDTGHKLEAIGSWDHGIEGYDVGSDDHSQKIQDVHDFTTCFRQAITSGISKIREEEHRFGSLIQDTQLQEKYRSHTEEIVSGEKMCVARVINQDSFDAPC